MTDLLHQLFKISEARSDELSRDEPSEAVLQACESAMYAMNQEARSGRYIDYNQGDMS